MNDAINEFQIDYTRINNQIVCIVKNNSKIDMLAQCQLAFYDVSGNLVSLSREDFLSLFRDDEYVAVFDIPDKEFQNYKLKFDKLNTYFHQINQKDKLKVGISEKYDYTYQYYDYLGNTVSDIVKLFDINLDNQSGKRVQFDACILYYKNNTLVSYTRLMNYRDLDVGVTTINKPQLLYYPTNRKIEVPEYDTCRIIYSARTNKY